MAFNKKMRVKSLLFVRHKKNCIAKIGMQYDKLFRFAQRCTVVL